MNATALQDVPPPRETQESYLQDGFSLRSWLLTTDHKRIAILYLVSITAFFFIGGAAAALVRYNLLVPQGIIHSAETYNRLFTMHGVVMVWFFLVPAVPVTLGNFVVPLMLGARDLAFPKLNLFSWYLFILGGSVVLYSLFTGGVDTGWTFYTPLTTAYSKGHVVATVVGIFIAGFSSIATGLNFIVTIHRLRAPGLTWFRLPVFLWSLYATSVILVLATPVLAMTLLLLAFERIFHIGVFDPTFGGDPLLFQHLFWFYSHPAVYIMILPGFGIVSEIIPAFSRKPLFGYSFVVWASIGIAVISFLVWGHHMFVAGTSLLSALVFSILSYMVAVPSAIKVFNWIGTMHRGYIHFDAPMLYALGFIGLFTMGGLTGLFVAALAADVHLTQTYFVVAHFHYVMVGGMVSAFFAGLHYWWPKITGRMYPEMWGRAGALIIFIGFHLTFFPQFILGYLGMPRRYHAYPPEFQVLNVLSSAGATILAAGYLLPLAYLTWSLLRGERAPANPWEATGLEWKTPSPPPTHNFTVTPVVDSAPLLLSGAGETGIFMNETFLPHEFQYGSAEHQSETAISGMWLFLASEMLFFGVLFLSWIFCRHWNPMGFDVGGRQTEMILGTINSVLLLTSSATYTAGTRCIEAGNARGLIAFCVITALLGLTFLGVKFGLEWHDDLDKHLFPGPDFAIQGAARAGAQLFFVFYFVSTALHGLHMVVGIGLLAWILRRARRGDFSTAYSTPVSVVGLYWSFVDMVWVVLYPLIYLVGRSP